METSRVQFLLPHLQCVPKKKKNFRMVYLVDFFFFFLGGVDLAGKFRVYSVMLV